MEVVIVGERVVVRAFVAGVICAVLVVISLAPLVAVLAMFAKAIVGAVCDAVAASMEISDSCFFH